MRGQISFVAALAIFSGAQVFAESLANNPLSTNGNPVSPQPTANSPNIVQLVVVQPSPAPALPVQPTAPAAPKPEDILALKALVAKFPTAAKPRGPLERPSILPECFPNEKRCTYVSQNTKAKDLISNINKALFGDIPLVGNADGTHLTDLNPGKISFWHSNPDLLERMLKMIPQLDRFDEYMPAAMVEVSVEIYTLTEKALSNLDAAVTSVGTHGKFGLGQTLAPGDAGGLKLGFNMGAVSFGAFLNAQKTKGMMKRMDGVRVIVPNGDHLSYRKQTPFYIDINGTQSDKDKDGIKIDADVAISQLDNAEILLKNYSFSFGVELGEKKINTLELNGASFSLHDGKAIILATAKNKSDSTTRGVAFNGFNRDSGQTREEVAVVFQAHPVSYEEFIKENRRMAEYDAANPHFSAAQIKSLPSRPQALPEDIEKALESLHPIALQSQSGDAVLGFVLDPRLATKEILRQKIHLFIKGEGVKFDKVRDIQNLMLGMFRFSDELPMEAFKKPLLQFKVVLEHAKEYGGPHFSKRVFKLIYNTDTKTLERVD